MNLVFEKLELGAVELEVLQCVHKLEETWNGNRTVLEEVKIELLETRGGPGGDPTNKHFYEHAVSSEPNPAEVRKCDSCHGWRMRKLSLHMIAIENSV